MQMFAQGLVVRSGHVTVRASFVSGQRVVARSRCPLPLSPDEALAWAIRFEMSGFPKAAEDIFARLCNGGDDSPVARYTLSMGSWQIPPKSANQRLN
jgi:hypothetical protein